MSNFPFTFDAESYRRIIAGKEIVVHCHHYNARLQRIIEGATQINGKAIFLATTEEIFADYLTRLFSGITDEAQKWQIVANLYAHLGFGQLDLTALHDGFIKAPVSHFVEGWRVGFQGSNCNICTFTEGFMQGAIYAVTGDVVAVREQNCLLSGAEYCQFTIDSDRVLPFSKHRKQEMSFTPKPQSGFIKSASVDEKQIIDAIVNMPFVGDKTGLIPAFNVYLANMPADFYSLLCHSFIKAMREINMQATAIKLLIYAGEVCALNTLRGIKASDEWEQLIQPMISDDTDNLHGLIAVTNALGWGNWHVIAHEPGEMLEMESLNGYEALGYLNYSGYSKDGQCYMLTGVAAGIMALLYRDGTVEERVGTFYSNETQCICNHHESCRFHVEAL